jgi:hypothetical protein
MNRPEFVPKKGRLVSTNKTLSFLIVFFAVAFTLPLAAQLQTYVPLPVPGAKPVTVEHIKVHGTALEGNLEGDAVDRDIFVFLPPSYAKEKHRRYQSSTRCMDFRSAPSNGRTKSTCRKPSKALSPRARKR